MKKIFFSLLACLLFPLASFADGGLIAPEEYYVQETSQKAVLFYEGATGMETMVLRINYTGNAANFAWIIPTPSQPQVEKGSAALFTNLSVLTATDLYKTYSDYSTSADELTVQAPGVEVLEEKNVDYYDITVLSADDATALSTWLNNHGYAYPEKDKYIFQDYIEHGWYFTAVKLTPDVLDNYNVTSALYSGTATPLQFIFSADKLVYPLKISQVQAAADYSYDQFINLYIITDHRQDVTGFTVNYADKISAEKIKALAQNTQGDSWIEPRAQEYFLTALYSTYAPSSMTEDLFPQRAEKDTIMNNKYQLSEEQVSMLIVFSLLFAAVGLICVLISPLGFFFIIYVIVFYLAKTLKVKMVFLVLQLVDTIITAIALLGSGIAIFISFRDLYSALEYTTYLDDEIFALCMSLAVGANLLVYILVKTIFMLREKKNYQALKNIK